MLINLNMILLQMYVFTPLPLLFPMYILYPKLYSS